LVAHVAAIAGDTKDLFCKYVRVSIGNSVCPALVDSGNVWRSAISADFCRQLGLAAKDLSPIHTKRLGTARSGVHLTVLGELTLPLKITMGGLLDEFKFKPVVISGLAMPINISGPFLKTHKIDQLHSSDSLSYKGKTIPLLPAHTVLQTRGSVRHASAYVAKKSVVPALSCAFLSLRVPDVERGLMPSGDAFLEGGVNFMDSTDLHPWTAALVACNAGGRFIAGVMNTTCDAITVARGQRYGLITSVGQGSQAVTVGNEEGELSLCVIDEKKSETSRLTGQARLLREAAAAATAKAMPGLLRASAEARTAGPPTPPGERRRQVRQALATAANNNNKNNVPVNEKRRWVREEFKINDSPCLRTETEKQEAVEILLHYWDVFSTDGSFGKTDLIQHEIHTKPGPPIKSRYRPVNPALEVDLKRQLAEWKEHDVIEPSKSQWSFALVAASKKIGRASCRERV
jgi:hypothetical protein